MGDENNSHSALQTCFSCDFLIPNGSMSEKSAMGTAQKNAIG